LFKPLLPLLTEFDPIYILEDFKAPLTCHNLNAKLQQTP
jgi:hypothetical protein